MTESEIKQAEALLGLPWTSSATYPGCIYDCDGDYVGELSGDADTVVNIVNRHFSLVRALKALHSVQNGPPLLRYKVKYDDAMKMTEVILAELGTERGEGR